ncbi:hypothetical protein 7S3_58 [uncultured Caudovirales phage]|uniref:Uncharacterized protein n=1 Tax=uncultured Caudovirales phage TaxID=2100421 RepID=A0A2H4J9Q2_9CAUD|nr:hypothetical protein 7S3_58 [uncultured Caudovirales phage]
MSETSDTGIARCVYCDESGPARLFIWRGGLGWFCARVSLCRKRRTFQDGQANVAEGGDQP